MKIESVHIAEFIRPRSTLADVLERD